MTMIPQNKTVLLFIFLFPIKLLSEFSWLFLVQFIQNSLPLINTNTKYWAICKTRNAESGNGMRKPGMEKAGICV